MFLFASSLIRCVGLRMFGIYVRSLLWRKKFRWKSAFVLELMPGFLIHIEICQFEFRPMGVNPNGKICGSCEASLGSFQLLCRHMETEHGICSKIEKFVFKTEENFNFWKRDLERREEVFHQLDPQGNLELGRGGANRSMWDNQSDQIVSFWAVLYSEVWINTMGGILPFIM